MVIHMFARLLKFWDNMKVVSQNAIAQRQGWQRWQLEDVGLLGLALSPAGQRSEVSHAS